MASRWRRRRGTLLLIVAGLTLAIIGMIIGFSVRPSTQSPVPGSGGPALLVTSSTDPYTQYYAEILRAEGVSSFRNLDLGSLTRSELDGSAVVLLPSLPLSPDQVDLFASWVQAGGKLIAFKPTKALAPLLGLKPQDSTMIDGYLRIDTTKPPGKGITPETIQFHGPSDLYATLPGTQTIATLYSNAATSTSFPAVSLRRQGTNSGRAVAFSYDLARSVIATRQGNPAWAGQDRDGKAPIRPNDLYKGKGSTSDYVDLNKAAVPQADEQQRLLMNIITELTEERSVLVRSWYLPKGVKAALVLSADDHSPGARTREALKYQKEQSPPGCSVADWECIRSTSLMYSNGSLTDSELAKYQKDGFDFGVHLSTGCKNWTPDSLRKAYTKDLKDFRKRYPSLPEQVATRIHCVAWSDYASGAKVGREFGIRLDLNYYYWPAEWVQNRPGFFTGSGTPMRFVDVDGEPIDVYQEPSHLVNESGMDFPKAIDLMLDRATGPLGYYGVFGTHYDYSDNFDRELIASASKRGVPMVSAAQLTEWLDARNSSSFTPAAWTGSTLSFDASVDPGARSMLRGMLPFRTGHGVLSALTQDGNPVTFSTQVIKGIEYAFFTATTGTYQAGYADDDSGPVVTACSPVQGSVLSSVPEISVSLSEPLKAATVTEETVHLADAEGKDILSVLSYTDGSDTVVIKPTRPLRPGSTYHLIMEPGLADTVGNPLPARLTFTYRTAPGSGSIWAPAEPEGVKMADGDRKAVELGLRFRTSRNGTVTGITIFKGNDRRSVHTVTLWDAKGRVLAKATTRSETKKGWQHARFKKPVKVRSGAVYTASYLAPKGRYAYREEPLAEDYTNGYLTALKGGDVYRYTGGFPTQDHSSSNYLVDVAFTAE